MCAKRITKKCDRDYWNARNYGAMKLMNRECNFTEKRMAEFLAKEAEKNRKKDRMKAFREIFENNFKEKFPKVFENIAEDLLSEWNRVANNKEIVCANIQVEQRLMQYGDTDALDFWRKLYNDLKNFLDS